MKKNPAKIQLSNIDTNLSELTYNDTQHYDIQHNDTQHKSF